MAREEGEIDMSSLSNHSSNERLVQLEQANAELKRKLEEAEKKATDGQGVVVKEVCTAQEPLGTDEMKRFRAYAASEQWRRVKFLDNVKLYDNKFLLDEAMDHMGWKKDEPKRCKCMISTMKCLVRGTTRKRHNVKTSIRSKYYRKTSCVLI